MIISQNGVYNFKSDLGLQGWIGTLRLNFWFLMQKQRMRKYHKKHSPCGIVFIVYTLRHTSFCQLFFSNLSKILKFQQYAATHREMTKETKHISIKKRLVMYRSNWSFNMPPPGQLPGHLTFLKIIVQIPLYGAKMPFKCPTLGSIPVIKCSHPGDISQAQKWQKEGGNAFSCRTKSL